MPNLPTLFISPGPVWDRLLAAFNSNPDEYKAWLKSALADEVLQREAETIRQQAAIDIAQRREQLNQIVEETT